MYNNIVNNSKNIYRILPCDDVYLKPEFNIQAGAKYILKGYFEENIFYPTEQPKKIKKIKLKVKNVLYNNPFSNYYIFSALILEYQDGNEIPVSEKITASGNFYNLYKDSTYSVEGYWKQSEKYSDIFVITESTQLKTSSIEILEQHLQNILKGTGNGKKTINKLIEKFQLDTIDIIRYNDEELKQIIKNDERRKLLRQLVINYEEKEKSLSFLTKNNFSINDSFKIIDKLGPLAYMEIQKNPNILFQFPFVPIKLIDKISINKGLFCNEPLRIEGLITRYISKKENENGDIYVDYDEFTEIKDESNFTDFVLTHGQYKDPINIIDVINVLNDMNINNRKINLEKNIIDENKLCVYRNYYLKAENYIIEKLYEFKKDICMTRVPDDFIENEINKINISLDNIQKQAIKNCLQNKISILTGGPGTGKTRITQIIVNIFNNYFKNKTIDLCAPTGKASRRMSEVINLPAQTIHKKLNCIPFSDMDLNEIDADLLIIDEVSMIDIDLFYKLLSNISYKTSIILVGDYNQLPSVGPGLILRDLIESKQIVHTELKTIFRQKENSNIITAAYNVLNGKNLDEFKNIKNSDFIFIETKDDSETQLKIKEYLNFLIKKKKCHETDIQILSPFNDGMLGTSGLNKIFKNMVNPATKDSDEIYISPTRTFNENDRVIQTKNNYQIKVYNGSIGYIENIDIVNSTANIDFYGDSIEYKNKDIKDLKLAYAITVHKSQGSEFDYIIMPLSINHMYINNINLLYTAITRAKTKFILIGQDEALNRTLSKIYNFNRKSQIKEKLINKFKNDLD